MRVGLNMLHLVPGETGGSELYARRLVPELLAARPDWRLTLFVASEAADSLRAERWSGELQLAQLPVRARSRVSRVAAEQTILPIAARRAHVDLLHNLFTTAPALRPVPQVTTILDVIYKRFPETHAGVLARGLSLLVPLAAGRSTRVITLSEAAKADIVRFLGVPPQRIDVTPLGPGMPDDVEPLPEDELRRRFRLGEAPLVLTVSAKRPHKNLERLLEAFAGVENAVLVAPGYPTVFEDELRVHAERLGVADRVRLTGWVDDATLEALYRTAACFVFPSLAEGFGLPVLEAMRRGTPVACSSASSLPELADGAALLFDPTDSKAIGAAIQRLLSDHALRERLSRAGPAQAARFTWARTAAATVESYERALAAA